MAATFTFKFQIDNKKKNIFRDAVDGYAVTECSSLACLSYPCFGSATCVEYNDKWHCLCPSGYSRINSVMKFDVLKIQIFWDVTMFCWVSGSWHFLAKFNNNRQFLPKLLFYLDHLTLDNEANIMLQNFGDHSSNNSKTHPQDANTHQTCYYSVGKVILLHGTKPYVEMEVQLHAFSIFPAQNGTNRSGSHPNHFAPQVTGCAGPTVSLCTTEKRKSPVSIRIEPHSSTCPAYSPVPIPTELPQLHIRSYSFYSY